MSTHSSNAPGHQAELKTRNGCHQDTSVCIADLILPLFHVTCAIPVHILSFRALANVMFLLCYVLINSTKSDGRVFLSITIVLFARYIFSVSTDPKSRIGNIVVTCLSCAISGQAYDSLL